MKQRRGSANKGDKPTGGLGSLGAWPNKSKKDVDSAKVIYLGDIDFDAPGEATATDILVRQHRTRVRVKRVKNKGTTRRKRRTKPKRRIRSGKPLHPEEDEVEYILTIGMMLGLRVAVGRQANPLAKPELTVEDFYQARFLLVCVFVISIDRASWLTNEKTSASVRLKTRNTSKFHELCVFFFCRK
ncbi:unnamed protein product [Ectocarpus sp. 4 AP-2014]